jgi:hypothetical protein
MVSGRRGQWVALSAVCSSLVSMTTQDSQDLQDFRRGLFQHYLDGESMPPAYLSELRRLVSSADTTIGIRVSAQERVAYWLEGRVLGCLSCAGSTDTEAGVQGWLLRLDALPQIDIEVKIYRGQWEDGPGTTGRILKINGNTILDASPGLHLSDKRAEIEQFIDRVLAVYSGK